MTSVAAMNKNNGPRNIHSLCSDHIAVGGSSAMKKTNG